jgi:sucrose-phosphate synthase
LDNVAQELEKTKSAFKLIISHEKYLDILPYRASKGAAVKYIAWKWQLENNQIITAGDSGNDSDMLTKPFKAIVVANHEESLNSLKKDKNVYFTKEKHAKGVIEALKHYAVIK